MTDQSPRVVGGRAAVRRAAARSTRRTRYLLAAVMTVGVTLGTVLVGNAVGTAATPPAPAPRAQICEQFGSTGVAGDKYVVQNDRWGAATTQCITPFDTGFNVDVAQHVNNKGPAGYPSILRGCNYGYCTAASPFPAQVSKLGTVRSNWSTKGPTAGGTQQYNTAYDIWFDPTSTNAKRNTGAEMMIWLNRTSWVQPIGKPYYDVNIGGTVYTVWYGKTDLPVISYVRKSATTSVTNLPIELFTRDAMLRGVVKSSWYMTSVQAGFEPWTGGTGLRTNSFSVTRNGQ
ncbi:GH12 family glycosyl hydrolase domain-containing protein [Actinomycetospora sp.]|uniref:GH12 family glycosyl hydrolase domain-containing protein n=1 Tax=Actinomycetospora sp. TaxID=1872135 RepID=UPI002F3EF67A